MSTSCQRSEHSPPRRSGTSPGGRRTESRRDDERAQHRCPARQPASRYSSAATRQCCRDGLRPPCHRPTWLAQALPRTSRPPVRRGSIDGADSTTDADVPVRAAMSFNGDRVAHTESSRRPQGDSGRDERRSPEESPDQHGEFGDRSHSAYSVGKLARDGADTPSAPSPAKVMPRLTHDSGLSVHGWAEATDGTAESLVTAASKARAPAPSR